MIKGKGILAGILLFLLFIFINQNTRVGGGIVNLGIDFEHSDNIPVIMMGVYGGYVPPDYAFLDEIPNLVIFGSGRFIQRVDDTKSGMTVWKEGYMDVKELKNLIQKINDLGFWEWDNKIIQKEISKRPLITDLPTTIITIALKDTQKVFQCYGLSVYSEKINFLKKPMEVYNLLCSLEPQQIYYPKKIELFIMGLEDYLSYGYRDIKDKDIIPWHFKTFLNDSFEKIPQQGYRTQIGGKQVAQIVKVLSEHKYFEFKKKHYLIRYRPYLTFLNQKKTKKWGGDGRQ